MRRRRYKVVPIEEAIAYAADEIKSVMATDFTKFVPNNTEFLRQRALKHAQYMREKAERVHRDLLDAKEKGARYVMGAARTPRLPHNGGPKCIAIVIDTTGHFPLIGAASNTIATDDPDEIDRTVNDDRPIYDPRFWRAWREERELDEIEAAMPDNDYDEYYDSWA